MVIRSTLSLLRHFSSDVPKPLSSKFSQLLNERAFKNDEDKYGVEKLLQDIGEMDVEKACKVQEQEWHYGKDEND